MKDRFSLSFKAFYLIYLGAIGSFIPYINTYLEKNAGLSGSQIGLITAISLVLGVCVIPIWGSLVIRPENIVHYLSYQLWLH